VYNILGHQGGSNMNSINDELVYKVHKLHTALNDAQNLLSILERENACLKKLVNGLTQNETAYQECVELKE
jgi:hypothetical protein